MIYLLVLFASEKNKKERRRVKTGSGVENCRTLRWLRTDPKDFFFFVVAVIIIINKGI